LHCARQHLPETASIFPSISTGWHSLLSRSGAYSHVEAQCFAVYPAVAGGADNLRYIQVHATTEGGTNITGITTLDERASAPSSLTLKDGYLNESTVVFEFRGGTSAAAYADVAYDAK
jgi:hypothetical protein